MLRQKLRSSEHWLASLFLTDNTNIYSPIIRAVVIAIKKQYDMDHTAFLLLFKDYFFFFLLLLFEVFFTGAEVFSATFFSVTAVFTGLFDDSRAL